MAGPGHQSALFRPFGGRFRAFWSLFGLKPVGPPAVLPPGVVFNTQWAPGHLRLLALPKNIHRSGHEVAVGTQGKRIGKCGGWQIRDPLHRRGNGWCLSEPGLGRAGADMEAAGRGAARSRRRGAAANGCVGSLRGAAAEDCGDGDSALATGRGADKPGGAQIEPSSARQSKRDMPLGVSSAMTCTRAPTLCGLSLTSIASA